MKKSSLLFFLYFIFNNLFSQNIIGQWSGVLKIQGTQLRVVFNVSKTDNGYSSSMDSPDQGAKGIPTTKTTFENDTLKIIADKLRMNFEGKFENDTIIKGSFVQNGFTFPLNLTRGLVEKAVLKRPQEPQKPYSYYSEDVRFENTKDTVALYGTLTLPNKDGQFPAVVLISGSGPHNRDEELMGHKPFLVLSDYLTKNGIAVLRYDDRGTAKSKGIFSKGTSFDFSNDAEAAFNYLLTRKEIIPNKIGLMGHSEGGLIAPMIAARNNKVAFVVMLAGTGMSGDQIMLLQQELIARADGAKESDIEKTKSVNKAVFDIIRKNENPNNLNSELTSYLKNELEKDTTLEKALGMSGDDNIKSTIKQITSPWFLYFLKYDPLPALIQVTCPVLAINGEKDLQVPPKENLAAIKKALKKGGNKNFVTKELPGLNHLFQECKTGSPEEYGEIEQTFSPAALSEILNWINIQTRK
jgi:pimeloyl-ACP methyl ester carboxylesterase